MSDARPILASIVGRTRTFFFSRLPFAPKDRGSADGCVYPGGSSNFQLARGTMPLGLIQWQARCFTALEQLDWVQIHSYPQPPRPSRVWGQNGTYNPSYPSRGCGDSNSPYPSNGGRHDDGFGTIITNLATLQRALNSQNGSDS